uniref:RDD family protein n=1 Tax=Streptomyces sp. PU-14G TaxID=2800808 RepID=UPI0034DFF8D1
APTPPATAGQEGPAGPPVRPRRSPSDETGPVFLDGDAGEGSAADADAGAGARAGGDEAVAPADAGPGAAAAGGRADAPAQAGFGPPADPRGGWGTDGPSADRSETGPATAPTPESGSPAASGGSPAASGGREHTVGLRRSEVLGTGRRTGAPDTSGGPETDSAADRAGHRSEQGSTTAVPGQRPGEPRQGAPAAVPQADPAPAGFGHGAAAPGSTGQEPSEGRVPGQAGPGRANPGQAGPGRAGPTVTSGSASGRADAAEQGAPARSGAAAGVPAAGRTDDDGQGGPVVSGQGSGSPQTAGQQTPATTGSPASPASPASHAAPASAAPVSATPASATPAETPAQSPGQTAGQAPGQLVPRREQAPALPGQREASGAPATGPGQGPGHDAPAQAAAVSPVRVDGAAAQGAVAPSWSHPAPTGSPAHQPVAGLPAQPPSGGPDAVTPWRPPVDDPFSRVAAQEARPAALGRRLGARLVDLVLTLAVGTAAAFPFVGKTVDHIEAKIDAVEQAGVTRQVWLVDGTTGGYLALVLGVLVVFGLLYEVLPTARWGRTLGKKLFGICVVNIEGYGKPGFAKSLLRWLVHGALGVLVIGLVNVLWCLFDRPWRQCWHDKVAGTFVAKGDASTELRL